MAGRIKGITVEIGGDTTGLEKALKNVNSTIKNTQSQLKDVKGCHRRDEGKAGFSENRAGAGKATARKR